MSLREAQTVRKKARCLVSPCSPCDWEVEAQAELAGGKDLSNKTGNIASARASSSYEPTLLESGRLAFPRLVKGPCVWENTVCGGREDEREVI